jgi:hypothetical protein
MKMSGSIRRTERKTGRSVASRKASPLFAFPQGTARRGPGAQLSGPGSFFPVGPPKVSCTVPMSVPSQRTFTSYFIPLERKSRLGATRSNFHE